MLSSLISFLSITFYSEWKHDSQNKLIDNILMFTENHTKYTERTLSSANNVSEK